MSQVSTRFSFEVEDINNTIRSTNVLLRAANAVRLSIRDLQHVWKKPTITNIMWTLVQLSRTYWSLGRLMRLMAAEANTAAGLAGIMQRIVVQPLEPMPVGAPPDLDFRGLSVRVDAFRDNIPMPLENIDLSNLPEGTHSVIQRLLEEDAELTVQDARDVLRSKVKVWTGTLADSINWQPEVDGVRITADAYYAWWVERGHRVGQTGYFPGYWYMTDATDRMRRRLPFKIWVEINQLMSQNT